jgi:hypothetical protein
MNKRSFLKAVGISAGFVMLPSLAMEVSTGINNCADLTTAMESMFTCKMGEPKAFMEFTKEQAEKFFTPAVCSLAAREYEQTWAEYSSDNIIRLTYQTFAYGIKGGTAEDAERKLSQYLYNRFKQLAENDKKMLVWRIKPVFYSYQHINFGDTWMTPEQIEDLKGLELNIPENVEYNFSTGSYNYVVEKTTVHHIRMRMVLPEITFDVANDLIKPEGVSYQYLRNV